MDNLEEKILLMREIQNKAKLMAKYLIHSSPNDPFYGTVLPAVQWTRTKSHYAGRHFSIWIPLEQVLRELPNHISKHGKSYYFILGKYTMGYVFEGDEDANREFLYKLGDTEGVKDDYHTAALRLWIKILLKEKGE